ncbi:MAG: hypothetical protein ABSE70_09130 [Candidatus Limnocylindrales bacterium]
MIGGRLAGRHVAGGLLAAALIGGLAVVLVLQIPRASTGSNTASSSAGATSVAAASDTPSGQPADATDTAGPSPSSIASVPPTTPPTPTRKPSVPAGPTPGASWQQDPAFVAAKMEGRVARDAKGQAVVLARAPELTFPAAASLATSWSGLIQEPPRTGTDDHGVAYTDYNYSSFCGAGAAAVTLYYWPGSTAAVTTKAGSFTEPVNWGSPYRATTYWKATGPNGNGRGMIMYLSEVVWPAPAKGLPWWRLPGVIDWTTRPAATYVANLTAGVNWEASGGSKLDYFYAAVPASSLSQADLQTFVHIDIHYGVPVIIAVRTSNGTYALPYWNVKSTSRAVNHFVTIVGYDDTAGTYSVMDTCGTTCNDKNARAGVKTMSQAAVFALIMAESDDDGVIW